MAKQSNNVVTHGLSGKIGDLLVFRQRGGKTIVAKMPVKTTKESEKQKHRRKFQQGVLYGKAAMADPGTKELYKAKAATKKLAPFNVE